jgi:hypothetical protein
MHALKLKVSIENHRLSVDLPADVPDGEAELVLLYREESDADSAAARRQHLEALFRRTRSHSPNRSAEDIDRQIAEERAGWDD